MVGREGKAAVGGCTEVVIKEPHYVPPVTGMEEMSVMVNDVKMNEGCHTTQGLLAQMMRWMQTMCQKLMDDVNGLFLVLWCHFCVM